ncbi:MAG TPA: dihydroorotate dehydrogenase-like protein [Phycisphaerae bacterium]|nr:dihydroorotate dehydrogenase-like protein [Phycisphaerae bacterium]HNU45686.1 dihydroorotate dehydrogenase-like protein [Phycisphaerae bacterium]
MDLTVEYLGLKLANPLVAAASPLSREVDGVRALADAGIAAVVLYSLFEEQIEHELAEHAHYEEAGTESFAEALSYLPNMDYFPRGPAEYIEHVRKVKQAVKVPVIASLNGTTRGGWIKYGRMLQDAGADAIELNIYHIATDPQVNGREVEARYLDAVAAVKEWVRIPVAVKLGPYFSSLAHLVRRLEEAGADGFVLFNRFYQPDIDLDTLEVLPDLVLSSPHEMRVPLRWIAILDPLVKGSLAASTGIYSAADVLKLLLAGADVTMLCAALLRNGPGIVPAILKDMQAWLQEHEYESVRQMQGSMNHRACPNPSGFERANYMKALQSYK